MKLGQPMDKINFDLFTDTFLKLGELTLKNGPEAAGSSSNGSLGRGLKITPVERDDGSTWFQATLNKVLRAQVRSDVDDRYAWDKLAEQFDKAGELHLRKMIMDDGILREDHYEDGVRTTIRFTDTHDQKLWSTIINTYDEFGQRTSKYTLNDDGTIRKDSFADGVRVKSVLTNDTGDQEWTEIESTYDLNGVLVEKITVYLDGSRRVETYQDGERAGFTLMDSGDELWRNITADYDLFGVIQSKAVLYDDGVERLDSYEDGLRTKMTLTDVDEQHEWAYKQRLFADEKARFERIEHDNGDQTLMFFDNGIRKNRIEFDRSGDEDWLFRITSYDTDGVAAVEQYVGLDQLTSSQTDTSSTEMQSDIDIVSAPMGSLLAEDTIV